MTAKQYLKQAYRLNELIECNRKELADLKELSTSTGAIDYAKDRVQTSQSADAPYTKIVMKIVELEEAINKDIEALFDLKIQIRTSINEVEDHDERLVLHKRYLNFETWDEICAELEMSNRTVHRIHSNALEHVKI